MDTTKAAKMPTHTDTPKLTHNNAEVYAPMP